jgi:hypothetical protein
MITRFHLLLGIFSIPITIALDWMLSELVNVSKEASPFVSEFSGLMLIERSLASFGTIGEGATFTTTGTREVGSTFSQTIEAFMSLGSSITYVSGTIKAHSS